MWLVGEKKRWKKEADGGCEPLSTGTTNNRILFHPGQHADRQVKVLYFRQECSPTPKT